METSCLCPDQHGHKEREREREWGGRVGPIQRENGRERETGKEKGERESEKEWIGPMQKKRERADWTNAECKRPTSVIS